MAFISIMLYNLSMKTRIAALFFSMVFVLALAAQAQVYEETSRDDYDLSLNFSLGSLGVGGLFPLDERTGLEYSLTVMGIGMEHNKTGLGMWFSPFGMFAWNGDDTSTSYSFANMHVYWNALSHRGLYLGPFASASYIFFDDAPDWGRYIFTAGLQAGLRMETNRVNMNFISVETGYRLIDGQHKFFVGAKVDLLPIFTWRGWGWLGNVNFSDSW